MSSLMEALEAYLRLRREQERRPSLEPCLDWDCGLANDMEGEAAEFLGAELARARKDLEESIERTIDDRVRSVLEQHCRNAPPQSGKLPKGSRKRQR